MNEQEESNPVPKNHILIIFLSFVFEIIEAVFLAQTHVSAMDSPYLKLISDRAALLKVQVIAQPLSQRLSGCTCKALAPAVSVTFSNSKDGSSTVMSLEGPAILPATWEGRRMKVTNVCKKLNSCFISFFKLAKN